MKGPTSDYSRSASGSEVNAGSVLDSSHASFDGQNIHRFGSIGAIRQARHSRRHPRP